jgi:hypothetical protein
MCTHRDHEAVRNNSAIVSANTHLQALPLMPSLYPTASGFSETDALPSLSIPDFIKFYPLFDTR